MAAALRGGGLAGRAVHLAAPGVVPRAHPGGRGARSPRRRWRCGPTRLRPLIEELGATFFEATTAMAFADFAARGAEIAVVEVGLGGRLDSTNVVRPLVSAVTKIELDHMKYLGDTLETIAGEKAGIAKPGAPFVIGERDPALVDVLRREARRACARSTPAARADIRGPAAGVRVGRAARPRRAAPAPQRRRGARHPDGAAPSAGGPMPSAIGARLRRGAACRAARPAGAVAVRRGPQSGRHARPGRGARATEPPPARSTRWSRILGDKEWPEMLVRLDPVVDRGVLTVAPTAAGRGWNLGWLRAWLRDRTGPRPGPGGRWCPTSRRRSGEVQQGAGTVLVTGSFHTVGDVMAALGLGE